MLIVHVDVRVNPGDMEVFKQVTAKVTATTSAASSGDGVRRMA